MWYAMNSIYINNIDEDFNQSLFIYTYNIYSNYNEDRYFLIFTSKEFLYKKYFISHIWKVIIINMRDKLKIRL